MKAPRRMDWRSVAWFVGLAMWGLASVAYAQDDGRMATIQKGIQFHDQGNYKAALAVYQSLLADNPKDEMVLYEIAMSYMAMKDYPACIEHAQRSAAIKSKAQAPALSIVASCQDDAGHLDAALKTFSKAVKLYPKDVQLNYNYGVSLARSGDAKRAAKYLQVAIEEAPAYSSPYRMYADVRKAQGHAAISTLLYLRFIMNEPNSDRSVDVAKKAVEPFLPRDGNGSIELNLGAISKKNSETHLMLDMMLGVARNAKVTEESPGSTPSQLAEAGQGKTEADRTVVAMQTFFLFVQVQHGTDAKVLAKDFGWQTAQPLWQVLGEKEVLITFFYHVADLAGVEGAREKLKANPNEVAKLNEVLTSWQQSLRK